MEIIVARGEAQPDARRPGRAEVRTWGDQDSAVASGAIAELLGVES